jgi:hypothetical protein
MSGLRERLAETIRTGVAVGFQDEIVNAAEVADAAILALRQWMDAEGLVCVPREATEGMHDKAAEVFHAERVKQRLESLKLYGEAAYASWPFSEQMWAAMIAAAPDVLGKP